MFFSENASVHIFAYLPPCVSDDTSHASCEIVQVSGVRCQVSGMQETLCWVQVVFYLCKDANFLNKIQNSQKACKTICTAKLLELPTHLTCHKKPFENWIIATTKTLTYEIIGPARLLYLPDYWTCRNI